MSPGRRADERGKHDGEGVKPAVNGIGADQDWCLDIRGIPEPAGSPKIITQKGRPFIIWQKGPKWTKAVRKAAEQQWTKDPIDHPVLVTLRFWLPKPNKPRFPSVPATRPDLDKLIRSTLDGLQGPVYVEDSRVVGVTATKWYANEEQPPGVEVWILDA